MDYPGGKFNHAMKTLKNLHRNHCWLATALEITWLIND
jgi:hypothetical protein